MCCNPEKFLLLLSYQINQCCSLFHFVSPCWLLVLAKRKSLPHEHSTATPVTAFNFYRYRLQAEAVISITRFIKPRKKIVTVKIKITMELIIDFDNIKDSSKKE